MDDVIKTFSLYRKNFYFLVIAFILCKCATIPPILKPTKLKNRNMETLYVSGREVVWSHDQHTSIALYGELISTGKGWANIILHMIYINHTENSRMDANPELIRVFGYNKKNTRKEIKVYSPEEYVLRMKNLANIALTFQAVAVGLQNYCDLQLSNNNVSFAALKFSNALDRAQMERTAEMYSQMIESTEYGLLKRHTLFPGEAIEGNVMVLSESSFREKYHILVPFGEDRHVFEIVYTEKEFPVFGDATPQEILDISDQGPESNADMIREPVYRDNEIQDPVDKQMENQVLDQLFGDLHT